MKRKETVKSEAKGGLVKKKKKKKKKKTKKKKTTQEDETPFNLIIVPKDAWILCVSIVLYNHI